MNGTIMFSVKMQDMMSGSLMKLGSNSNAIFAKMSNHTKQITDKNKVLGMSYNELQNRIKEVENTISRSTIPSQIRSAKRELESLQKQADKHVGNTNGSAGSNPGGIGIGGIAVGSMLGGLAAKGATMIMGAVTGGVGEMISRSMDKERTIAGMSTFLGKQGATEAYKNIRKDAEATPFDTASLLSVNQALISAGANAKNARTDSMNLANAIVAVGKGNDELTRMAANMQQIKTVGKATTMDIKQFGYAGINIYEILARSTGKSVAQVREMDVTYEQLSKALAMAAEKGGIYEGALKNAQNSKWGKWSDLTESLGNSLGDIGDAFDPVINKVLDLANKFADNIQPMLERAKPYIDMISNGIGKVVDYVMNLVNGTSEWEPWLVLVKQNFWMIWGHVKNIGLKLWELISRIIEFVKHSELLKDTFKFIGWIMHKVGNIIEFVMHSILFLWNNVLEPVLSKIEAVYRWIKGTNTVHVKGSHTLNAPKKPKEDALTIGTALAGSNDASSKTKGDTVAGAGPKIINIHVGKFFDNLQFTTLNTGESANEIEKIVMECFARVVYNGSKMV